MNVLCRVLCHIRLAHVQFTTLEHVFCVERAENAYTPLSPHILNVRFGLCFSIPLPKRIGAGSAQSKLWSRLKGSLPRLQVLHTLTYTHIIYIVYCFCWTALCIRSIRCGIGGFGTVCLQCMRESPCVWESPIHLRCYCMTFLMVLAFARCDCSCFYKGASFRPRWFCVSPERAQQESLEHRCSSHMVHFFVDLFRSILWSRR